MKGVLDMIKRNWPAAVLVVVLAASALAFRGCDDKDFRRNVRAGAAAATEFKAQVDDLCRAELLNPASCEKLQPRADRLAKAGQRINAFVDATPKLTAENKQELLGLVGDIITELDDMERSDELEFKDQEQRRKFLLAITVARAAVRIAQTTIDAAPVDTAAPTSSNSPEK